MTPLIERTITFWHSADTTRRWRLALCLLIGVMAICLLLAPKPWVAAAEIGGKVDTLDYVKIYGWIAGAINIVLLGGLVAICPWWTRKHLGRSRSTDQLPHLNFFWPLVILAMLTTFFYSLPRMAHGFWDDEELSVRSALWGKFRPNKKTKEVEFRRLPWLETIYGYDTPNNHTLFSILSRLCQEAWNAVSKPKGFPLVEWPFRVPALLFGILAVAAVAWLLKDLQLPDAGIVAAFLLAVHPWHIRYASEARGYSLLIFLVPVLFVFWRRAMIGGQWKWWSAFAFTEFSLIYCYPGSVFILVLLNLATLFLFKFGLECAEPRVTQAGRWFSVNVLAAALTLQLMLPLYPQAKLYFDFVSSQGFVSGWPGVRNTICYMLGGAPWTKGEPWEGYPEYFSRYLENPGLFITVASVAVALVTLGGMRLLRHGWVAATFVLVLTICPLFTYLLAYLRKFFLYESYVIYLLPGTVICGAVGLTLAASWIGKLPGARQLVLPVASCILLGYFFYTSSFRQWIVKHPLQQIRESVLYCRGTLDPGSANQSNVRTASFCIPPYLYDAHMERVDSAGAFIALLQRADAENIPLFLNIGMPWAAQQYSPQMWQLFNTRQLFEEPIRLRGFEQSLDRLVAKYKPKSATHFDFKSYNFAER
ncbi:MAG TPA: glycosyltransferase family 39 protein [Terrimicrobiaceae bacterium]